MTGSGLGKDGRGFGSSEEDTQWDQGLRGFQEEAAGVRLADAQPQPSATFPADQNQNGGKSLYFSECKDMSVGIWKEASSISLGAWCRADTCTTTVPVCSVPESLGKMDIAKWKDSGPGTSQCPPLAPPG